jgi:hypothetical protein
MAEEYSSSPFGCPLTAGNKFLNSELTTKKQGLHSLSSRFPLVHKGIEEVMRISCANALGDSTVPFGFTSVLAPQFGLLVFLPSWMDLSECLFSKSCHFKFLSDRFSSFGFGGKVFQSIHPLEFGLAGRRLYKFFRNLSGMVD